MTELIPALLIGGLYISALGRSLVDAKYHAVTQGGGEMPPAIDIYVKYPYHFLSAWIGGFCKEYATGIWYALSTEAQDEDEEVEGFVEADRVFAEAIKKAEEESVSESQET